MILTPIYWQLPSISGGRLLHSQPDDTPCRGDMDPLNMVQHGTEAPLLNYKYWSFITRVTLVIMSLSASYFTETLLLKATRNTNSFTRTADKVHYRLEPNELFISCPIKTWRALKLNYANVNGPICVLCPYRPPDMTTAAHAKCFRVHRFLSSSSC
jgi:hypothetical protein